MKYFILSIIILTYGCEGAYPKENDLIKKAYNDGLEQGVKVGRAYCGLDGIDSVMLNGNIYRKKVVSITLKYDSIMIINFDSSEVK